MTIKNNLRINDLFKSFLILFLTLGFLAGISVNCIDEYVYYGVIPSRLYLYRPYQTTHGSVDITKGWYLDKGSVQNSGFIAIVASKEDTHVKVYTLPEKRIVSEASLDFMESHFVQLPNGTVFKVVSDKPVTVLVFSGKIPEPDAFEGITPNTFYLDVDGSYVGRDFVFMASQGLAGQPYHIFSLEPAEVTVIRDDGTKQSFRLNANEHKALSLKAFRVYQIKSTGNIMIQSGGVGGRSFFTPSAEGGFVGRRFYSASRTSWNTITQYGFRISSLHDANVKIWDLQYKRLIEELKVKAGETVSVKPKAADQAVIAVESDKPITFEFVHDGDIEPLWSYGAGVSYVFIRPNEETPLYFPTNSMVEVYVFAYEDTLVQIDDLVLEMKADSYIQVSLQGSHKISSDKNIIIEMIHWPLIPPVQGIQSFGVVAPSIQAVSKSTNIALTPIVTEQNFPLTALWIICVASFLIAAGFIFLRHRSRKG